MVPHSEDLQIRAFNASDTEDMIAVFQAPKCQLGTLQPFFQSVDAIRTKLQNPPAGLERLVAYIPSEDRVVGMIGLHTMQGRRSHTAGIGMFVHDDYQGRGIGSQMLTEAIRFAENWLRIQRLELTVYTDNQAAIHMYTKCGFEREGLLRAYALRDGAWIDAIQMARIHPDLLKK